MTTREVFTQIVLPLTSHHQCAYIDLYAERKDAGGRALVAPATVFISHAWEYCFIQTMDVILELALRERVSRVKLREAFMTPSMLGSSRERGWLCIWKFVIHSSHALQVLGEGWMTYVASTEEVGVPERAQQ